MCNRPLQVTSEWPLHCIVLSKRTATLPRVALCILVYYKGRKSHHISGWKCLSPISDNSNLDDAFCLSTLFQASFYVDYYSHVGCGSFSYSFSYTKHQASFGWGNQEKGPGRQRDLCRWCACTTSLHLLHSCWSVHNGVHLFDAWFFKTHTYTPSANKACCSFAILYWVWAACFMS